MSHFNYPSPLISAEAASDERHMQEADSFIDGTISESNHRSFSQARGTTAFVLSRGGYKHIIQLLANEEIAI